MLEFIKSEKFYLPIIYIIVGIILYGIIERLVRGICRVKVTQNSFADKRKVTIITLIKSIIKYAIAIIVVILILDVYGVNTTSLIASLGIAAAIIGLAFQDTIKDFLSGVFLIFDNAYVVGDTVKINDFTGEVISLGLRTTKLRSYTGEVKILSNSSFTEVINYNKEHSKLVMQIPVHYDTSIEKLEVVLNKIKELIIEEDNVYVMELLGIDEFGVNEIKYAVMIECKPMTHYGIKRKLLGLIKKYFDDEGIKIPYSQVDVHIDK